MGSQRNCTWILRLAGFRVVTTESALESLPGQRAGRRVRSRGPGAPGHLPAVRIVPLRTSGPLPQLATM